MMRRGLLRAAGCAAVLLFCLSAWCAPAQTAPQNGALAQELTHLVCTDPGKRTRLEEILRACGLPVVSVAAHEYSPQMLGQYTRVVTAENAGYGDAVRAGKPVFCIGPRTGGVEGVDTQAHRDVSLRLRQDGHTQTVFARGEITLIGSTSLPQTVGTISLQNGQEAPFAAIGAGVGYAPWYRENDLGAVMLADAFRRWAGLADEKGKMYVLFDEIYPFTNLELLCITAEKFHASGIPFVLRIMPVYDNLDYPAFQRYAQVLRYAQSLGGSVVLHDPLTVGEAAQYAYDVPKSGQEEIQTRLQRTKDALEKQGILRVDMNLPPLRFTVDEIAAMESDGQNFGALPVDTMICFSPFQNEAELDEAVERLNALWLPIGRYGEKQLAGAPKYDETPVDETFEYRQEEERTLSGFFKGANKILVLIVALSVVVFILMLTLGRRLYRRKFYKR